MNKKSKALHLPEGDWDKATMQLFNAREILDTIFVISSTKDRFGDHGLQNLNALAHVALDLLREAQAVIEMAEVQPSNTEGGRHAA